MRDTKEVRRKAQTLQSKEHDDIDARLSGFVSSLHGADLCICICVFIFVSDKRSCADAKHPRKTHPWDEKLSSRRRDMRTARNDHSFSSENRQLQPLQSSS